MLVHAEQVVHRYLRARDVRRPAAARPLRPVRGRRGHRGDVLHLRQPDGEQDSPPRATRSRWARRSSRRTSRSRTSTTSACSTVEVGQSEIADGRHTWQYPDAELDKLEDPRVKAFFLVNPSNPASFAMRAGVHRPARVAGADQAPRPASSSPTTSTAPSSPGFRSLAADLPHNTHPGLLVLEALRLHRLAPRRGGAARGQRHRRDDRAAAGGRSRAAAPSATARSPSSPTKLKFIDRMVADSRAVALNHTAGLSLPQQVQMTLFSLFALLDERRRLQASAAGTSSTTACERWSTAWAWRSRRTRCASATTSISIWGCGGATTFGEDFIDYVARAPRSARHRARAGPPVRHGAAQRQRLRRPALVGARLARQPRHRGLRADRPAPARDRERRGRRAGRRPAATAAATGNGDGRGDGGAR